MSNYLIIRNALVAIGYGLVDARRIAQRLSKHKAPLQSFNKYYGQGYEK